MDILSAATMLFLIMDPLGNLPIVLSILKHIDPKRRRKVLIRELIFALLILMLFLFAGQSILSFLHVQPETLSISGGIILFIIRATPKTITIYRVSEWVRSNTKGLVGKSKMLYITFCHNISAHQKNSFSEHLMA
ncbi:TPA: antibiotic resistance protein MarC [Vibrio parahaemolyticus]|nr:antibiotic resistance protein MarC [Vibrio parahaemolyticus]HCE2112286.1 antibiotic resistance protein MarC [Vibrio parahaemolyticus]HCG6999894.1 antibiotic resistance protein MarC [Vibrio parahaemolyticus]HCG7010332.1 antibiotic resistance protein MarC [Vibrio parahaemolyticus]HCG7015728.1 antibiotic resistance protein MarC [Vibrio parahaemolyticus]